MFVGRACAGDPAVPPPPADHVGDAIAVVERGVCTFTEKLANVESVDAYDAVVVFNRTASDGCDDALGMTVEGTVPAFGVLPRSQGFALFDASYDAAECRAGDGTQLAPIAVGAVGDTVSFSTHFDGWGYVRLFRNGNGEIQQLDTYAIPQALDEGYAEGYGDLSIHEVATSKQRNDLLYFAYYAGGFRVARITEDEKLEEVGSYIDVGGSNFWGVEVFESAGKEYVAASDRDHGLYIFEYTGGQ